MALSLPPLARIHYHEYQKGDHKLRVAASSDPSVCCFCQKCVKLKITHSSLDTYFLTKFWLHAILVSTAASAIERSTEVTAVLFGHSTVKTS